MGLTKKETEIVYLLAEQITSSSQQGRFRKEVLPINVARRMREVNKQTLADYLRLVQLNPAEKDHLISALTIHTTSWFREDPHFKLFRDFVLNTMRPGETFKVWSAACSSGEEPYSFAFELESIRHENSQFNYQIDASDLDPRSVEKAQAGVYSGKNLSEIPLKFHPFAKMRSPVGGEEKIFVSSTIKERTHFFQNDLTRIDPALVGADYDVIICRNVLIYFTPDKVQDILSQLVKRLRPGGLLILGHSEAQVVPPRGLKAFGNSSYIAQAAPLPVLSKRPQKRECLVVDDSPTICATLRNILKDFQVTECSSAEQASEVIAQKKFDLITLDLNLPGENGAQWLKRQRNGGLKTPVVIISESTPQDAEKVFGALESGAQDYVVKSNLHKDPLHIKNLLETLAGKSNPETARKHPLKKMDFTKLKPEVIVIGASTGGPEALCQLLKDFPRTCPPVLVVQHISAEFAGAFSRRLAKVSGLALGVNDPRQPLQSGTLYMAQGDAHLEVILQGGELRVQENEKDKYKGHRPSVDELFFSVAATHRSALGVVLTGMGDDGARGLQKLTERGTCYGLAQDEKSSVVYGMPRQAAELGAVSYIGNIVEIRDELLQRMESRRDR